MARKSISLGRRQDEGLARREASTGRSDLRFGGGVVESRDEKRRPRESLCEKKYEKELRSSLRTLRRYDFFMTVPSWHIFHY